MNKIEAIEQLRLDMELILFEPNTGEELTLEQVRLHNEDNYKMYLADELAIKALEELQMYHDGKLSLVPSDVFSKICEENDTYKEIGTQDECEWNWSNSFELISENHPTVCLEFKDGMKFCPYCGKKMKVVVKNEID